MMYSPHVMSIPYMTKQNRRRKASVNQKPKATKPKPTPFADAGAIVGSKLASTLNLPYLRGVGKWLGSGIGQIFGSGDYQIVGANPAYNVMMNGNQLPSFSSTRQTNIVCHREYLGDIQGTAAFTNRVFPLNPGVATTFPWLSTIAQNYQEYKFHGVIFEFRSLITDFVTNGAPGVVVMATNYNADAPVYLSKQEMENSEFAVSVKPTRELIHGVECATPQTVLSQLYVRSGQPPAGQDLRLYDLGNFQFATVSNPTQNLGELWVSYCVEFFKPILPADVGGNLLSYLANRSSISGANPLGLIQQSTSGDLFVSVTSTNVVWTGQPGNIYFVNVYWQGTVDAAVQIGGAPVLSGLTALSVYNNKASNVASAPNTVVTCRTCNLASTVQCTLDNPGLVSWGIPLGGTYPAGTTFVTIQVSQYSSEAV